MTTVGSGSKATSHVVRALVPLTIGTIALVIHESGFGVILAPCIAGLVAAFMSLQRSNRRLAAQAESRKVVESDLRFQAFHDALTGLANRALFNDRLEHALARRRRTGERVGLLLIDLDDFKSVNDSRGHDAGDLLLEEVSHRLAACTRSSDTVARFGGDEFVVLVEQWQGSDELERMGARVLAAFVDCVQLEGRRLAISASIGVAEADEAVHTPVDLLRRADEAMYAAKARGKGQAVAFVDDSLQSLSAP